MNTEKLARQALHYENVSKAMKEAAQINTIINEINNKIRQIIKRKDTCEKNYNQLKLIIF
jgi:hypothetical protein